MNSSFINSSSFNKIDNYSNDNELNSKNLSIELFNQAEAGLIQLDKSFSLLEEQSGNVQLLKMMAKQQQQLVLAIVGNINSEFAIAQLLAASIESYTATLEAIELQTQGIGAFMGAMEDIWGGISQAQPISGSSLEDAFQLVLMDVLIHPDDYPNLNATDIKHIQRFMECGGSGMHGSHEGYDKDEFERDVAGLFNKIKQSAPTDSLARKIVDSLSTYSSCPQALTDQFTNGWGSLGTWSDEWNNGTGDVSPIMRMALLSNVLSDPSVELSSEEYKLFLTGSLADIDSIFTSHYSTNTIGYINHTLPEWNFHPGPDLSMGYGMNFWSTEGMTVDYFKTLSENLPTRPLTSDEVKQITNIKEAIQMLQETLKYWLSVIRDEQLSIARNI